MEVKYVYNGHIVGYGHMTILPRQGDFIESQPIRTIFKVEAVMFEVVSSGDTKAIIYLVDIMAETKTKLRYY